MFGRQSTAQRRKAWLNRTLKQNKVPTFWLSNSFRDIDPTFMRRFNMVVDLPVPPRGQRERIVHTACADLLDDGAVKRIAESEELACRGEPGRLGGAQDPPSTRTGHYRTHRALADRPVTGSTGHAPLRQAEAGPMSASNWPRWRRLGRQTLSKKNARYVQALNLFSWRRK